MHLSVLSPRGGGVYVGHFGQNPYREALKFGHPYLGEGISLKFIVFGVNILQIIDINCQAFLLIPLMLCLIRGK